MSAVDEHVAGSASKANNPNGRIKRDRWKRYVIPHPATGEEQSWTRATTLAGTLEDRYSLEQWDARNIVLGIGARNDLYAKAASCTADDYDELTSIVREAKDASKSSSKANLGTAVHRFSERVDAGELDPRDVAAEWRPDVAAYSAAMRANDILVVPGWLERVLLVPELNVAGTTDRLLQHMSAWPKLRIGDLKTGKVEFGWLKIAIQLALYANATHWYDPVAGQVHEIDEDVDRDVAIVMHLPVGKAECTLYEVDIAAGWQAAQVAYDVREWRKRKDIAVAFGVTPAVPAAAPVEAPSVEVDPGPLASPERIAWLRQRVALIYEHQAQTGNDNAQRHLEQQWRTDVCPPPIGDGYSDEQVSQAAAWCDATEREYEMPFPDVDPLIEAAFPGAETVDPATLEPLAAPDPLAESKRWADKAREILDGFGEGEVLAIATAAGMSQDDSRMSERRYRNIDVIVGELADPDGAVRLVYDAKGPEVVPEQGAAELMEAACTDADGNRLGRSAALTRAKTIARDLGLPLPRGLAKAAEQPLLAAYVAAGHGAPTTESETGK